MVGRMEVMNEIAYTKFDDEVIVPSIRKAKTVMYELPSDNEIDAVLKKAKEVAIKEAANFGISLSQNIDEYDIRSRISCEMAEPDDEYNDDLNSYDNPDFDTHNIDVEDSHDAFVYVNDENGVQRKVRKSTFIWMLTEPSQFLSKDRLTRFKSRKRLRNEWRF